jgi:hypothetical protein
MQESTLGFQAHDAQTIDSTINRISHGGKINDNHMDEIVKRLTINAPERKTPASAQNEFFNKFRDGDDFHLEKFVLTGFLLCNSSNREKADYIFHHCDPQLDKILQKDDFAHALDIMIDISCNILPALCKRLSKSEYASV